MRNETHVSLISRLAGFVDEWRKAANLNQLTVVDEIVTAHNTIGGAVSTEIRFENNPDEWNRLRANSERVYRWLDDKSKDRNLFPLNFLPSVLAAMPDETRRAFLSEMLAPLGLGVRALDKIEEAELSFDHICDTNIEATNAMQLIALAHKDPTEANLEKAEHAVQKVTERFARTRKILAGAKAKCKTLFGKLRHPKVSA